MILANSGKHEDAEDVLQEAVLILFKNFSKPDFELRSTVSTYLFSISRKIWLRKLKSNSKKRVTSLDKLQLSTKDDFDEKELEISRKRLYRKTFEKLDKDCREVLRLFFNKHSMQEIAQQLNYGSISYAKKKKFMCKKKLIALIKSDPFYKELST